MSLHRPPADPSKSGIWTIGGGAGGGGGSSAVDSFISGVRVRGVAGNLLRIDPFQLRYRRKFKALQSEQIYGPLAVGPSDWHYLYVDMDALGGSPTFEVRTEAPTLDGGEGPRHPTEEMLRFICSFRGKSDASIRRFYSEDGRVTFTEPPETAEDDGFAYKGTNRAKSWPDFSTLSLPADIPASARMADINIFAISGKYDVAVKAYDDTSNGFYVHKGTGRASSDSAVFSVPVNMPGAPPSAVLYLSDNGAAGEEVFVDDEAHIIGDPPASSGQIQLDNVPLASEPVTIYNVTQTVNLIEGLDFIVNYTNGLVTFLGSANWADTDSVTVDYTYLTTAASSTTKIDAVGYTEPVR